MPESLNKILIRDVVKSLLIQEGSFTDHKMMQYMDIALRGLKELSYDVAKAHGGEFKVESKENMGSSFSIILNPKS